MRIMQNIRSFLLGFAVLLGLAASGKAETVMKVTLLGTASATTVSAERFGMSTLVEVNGQSLLFDAGRGALIRLYQKQVPLENMAGIFITHLHSDHIVGLPDIYATAPLLRKRGLGRVAPLQVWGPSGIDQVLKGVEIMLGPNNRIRQEDHEEAAASAAMQSHLVEPGVVYQKDGVTVTAFLVDHGLHVKPAYGYRVDYKSRSVLISGDTRYTPNLVRHAQHVDLLVHCVAVASPAFIKAEPDSVAHYFAYLASPQDVARVFSETKPQLAVLSHISFLDNPALQIKPATDQELDTAVRQGYAGNFVLGRDLETFTIADDGQITDEKPGR